MSITREQLLSTPLTKLLAPKSIDQIILLPRVMKLVEAGIHNNFLFYGPPGTGKSTLAKILADKYVTMYVNASIDGSIDNLRNNITKFAIENPVVIDKLPTKVLYLDEIDGASSQFFDAFRGVTEMYPDMRVVATANKFYKLQKYEYILSRFECINFNPESHEEREWSMNKYRSKFKQISKALALNFESDEIIDYVVKKKYPDYREIYKFLQKMFKTVAKGAIIDMELISGQVYEFADLYQIVLNKDTRPEQLHEYLMINYSDKCNEVVESLDRGLISYIMEKEPQYTNIIGNISILNADHQHKMSFCMDQTTVMRSLAFNISLLIKKQNLQS